MQPRTIGGRRSKRCSKRSICTCDRAIREGPDMARFLAVIVIGASAWAAWAGEANWPQFRGPDASGVAADGNWPETWSLADNVAWKSEIPGMGWSSPIVWGNKVYLTTVVSEGKTKEAKKGLYFGGDQAKPPADPHR